MMLTISNYPLVIAKVSDFVSIVKHTPIREPGGLYVELRNITVVLGDV